MHPQHASFGSGGGPVGSSASEADLHTLPFPESLGFDDAVRVEVAECLVITRAELTAARAKIRDALDGDAQPDAEARRWLVRHLTLVENALSAVRKTEL